MLKNMSLGAPEDVDTEMLGTVVLYSFLEMQLNGVVADRLRNPKNPRGN